MAAVEVVLTRVDSAVAPRLAGLIGGVAIRAPLEIDVGAGAFVDLH